MDGLEAAQMHIPKLTGDVEASPYFEGRSLTLAPNIRQGKHFFCVPVCCMGNAVYLAGRHLKKIGLELKILCSEEHFLRLKQFKYY